MKLEELQDAARARLEIARVARQLTIDHAHEQLDKIVFGFTWHLESTLAGLSAQERSSLLDRAATFFQDSLNRAAKDVMLACIFQTEEDRAKQGVTDFITLRACFLALKQFGGK